MRIPSSNQECAVESLVLTLEQCFAKTWKQGEDIRFGRTVDDHCRIAGAVASCLAARIELLYRGLLPEHAALPALLHDIGKLCPTFQAKLYDVVYGERQRRQELALKSANPAMEHNWGGHGAISYASLMAAGAPETVARIAGEHHGSPTVAQSADRPGYGGIAWERLRQEVLGQLLGGEAVWPEVRDSHWERVICGLTIVADWIASGWLFDNPANDGLALVEQAVDAAGFRWPRVKPCLRFEDIFSFSPRPAQEALFTAICEPGVYVLEAPMGVGKTEAALYAAYRMLERGLSSGIYFALPTRLTSNRIHQRVNNFLEHILEEEHQALLLHGMAWLERCLQQTLGKEGAPNCSWFERSKRGILAPFAVGTVDQALLSVTHVRHGALRTFGLAGKTVILDEVHSYDAYTGTLLDALVEQLRAIGCTVIILSATLTEARRTNIMGLEAQGQAYPLISAAPKSGAVTSVVCAGDTPVSVQLGHPVSDDVAVEEALLRAEQGQRVLWIENTVAEAQQMFCRLAARTAAMGGIPTGLLHSRFTPADRAKNEERWTAFFAHDDAERGRAGGIVVGTQVVEQSLDIDADFLVSRFCPTDMILQRLGRLWRHGTATCRSTSARREAWLLHPCLEEGLRAPQECFGHSAFVYAPYVLCRSLELWHDREQIELPNEIRPILEATYREREEREPALLAAWQRLCEQKEALRLQALRTASTTMKPGEDTDVATRINQRKECDVVLLRGWDEATRELMLVDGTCLRLPLYEEAKRESGDTQRTDAERSWRERAWIAGQIALHVVRVPKHLAPDASLPPPWLKNYLYCDALRIALVDNDGSILQLDGSYPPHAACYDAEQGYRTGFSYAQQE